MAVLTWILSAAIGYFLGNIQTGLLVGRLRGNVDLRKHGSGSSGATNALRVLGGKSALWTFLGDVLKGVIAVLLGRLIGGSNGGYIAGVAVIVGHIWPMFFSFRGGKGVATAIGVITTLMPLQALLMAIAGVIVLLLCKMVSLASIIGALVFLVAGVIAAVTDFNLVQLLFVLITTALVIFAHRENIKRIRAGTENKVSASMFKKK